MIAMSFARFDAASQYHLNLDRGGGKIGSWTQKDARELLVSMTRVIGARDTSRIKRKTIKERAY